jgi:hypothetical protein
MDAGAQQDLVRVDVADAGNRLLIHQPALDTAVAPPRHLRERVGVEAEGIRPQLPILDDAPRIVADGDEAELPRRDIVDATAIAEHQLQVGVFRYRLRAIGDLEPP